MYIINIVVFNLKYQFLSITFQVIVLNKFIYPKINLKKTHPTIINMIVEAYEVMRNYDFHIKLLFLSCK